MFEDGFAGILRFQEFYKVFVSQSVESYTGSQMQSLFFCWFRSDKNGESCSGLCV